MSRRKRCRKCPGCVAQDCGKCVFCLDMVQFGGHGKRKQSCMIHDCHELKSNSYAANWNLPHKINNQLCSLHAGEPQRKKWCDRECGGESEQLSQLSIISKKPELLECASPHTIDIEGIAR